ncbi:MAG: site-specific integrase [Bacillaceae bacterium]|nr:site-specific integrase [Bacillaceae bacterium]
MSQIINELSQGTFIEPSEEKVREYLTLWLQNKKTNIRKSTYEIYEIIINKHVIRCIGDIPLSKLNPLHIQNFYTSLSSSLSTVTILKIHKTLKTALGQAVKYGLIQKNPVELVDAPRPQKKEMKTWNEEEVRQFLDVAEPSRYYIVYLLAVTTGMRRGEILGLRWQDIDFKLKTLSIKKNVI